MCRLFFTATTSPTFVAPLLCTFSEIARTSKRWQGDGWGIGYLQKEDWIVKKGCNPLWEDEEVFSHIPASTKVLAHARGALDKKTIAIANNHPFQRGEWLFAFNGFLQGVRLHMPGRIGAEKIFNLLLASIEGKSSPAQITQAIHKAMDMLVMKSQHFWAINFVLTSSAQTYVYSRYSEDPDYYAIRYTTTQEGVLVCSQEFGDYDWKKMGSGELQVFL